MKLGINDKYSSLALFLDNLPIAGIADVSATPAESLQIRSWLAYNYESGNFKTIYSDKLSILYIIKEN